MFRFSDIHNDTTAPLCHCVPLCATVCFIGTQQNSEQADRRDGMPLVSFNHVIDPHFVTLSSSLYTTSRTPNPVLNPNPIRS